MAKWFGKIGFAVDAVEVSPGIYEDVIEERSYFGDVTRNSRRLQSADKVNDNIVVSNEISIISDPFADTNFHEIRYITFMGKKWKASNVEVQYPRLILTIGDVYNE